MENKELIKKYIKENLRIEVVGENITLKLEGEIISAITFNSSTKEIKNVLMCDCCGAAMGEDMFCGTCSEEGRPVCVNCCSCFL